MGNPVGNAGAAVDAPPDRVSVVRNLVGKKILALSKVVVAPNTDNATFDSANDEIRLSEAWAAALDAADPATLPTPDQDQPLLDAIQTVDHLIDASAAANQLALATATLINTFKVPG